MDENIFAKVESDVLREKIYTNLVNYSVEIQIQLSNNELLSIKSYKRALNNLVIFRDLNDQPVEQDVIVSFTIPPERYFLKTNFKYEHKTWVLELGSSLYKLQRRKNFRLSLPKLWDGKFLCKLQNAEPVNITFDIFDISSGGFSFEYNHSSKFQVAPDAELEGRLTIKNKIDFNVTAIVKHYKESGTKAYPKIRVGLEFKNLSQKDESTIMTILMEVHREIFSRLK